MIEIVDTKIDVEAVRKSVESQICGAAVLFTGSTRRFTCGRETEKLFYECYPSMALAKMRELHQIACQRWDIHACSIVHRIGEVDLGEVSIAVATSSPHRKNSFESAQWLIDTLKKTVPIWKKEIWTDGSTEWVHPDNNSPQQPM